MTNKILIVEDEKKIRELYKKLLTAEGFQVLEAENGEEATVILLQDKEVDLFLLDIHVPVVDGAAFFDAVKLFNPHAKIVVSSIYPVEEQRRLIENADAYFDKAEGEAVLLDRVKKVLNLVRK